MSLVRTPLAQVFDGRTGYTTSDAFVLNGFVEQDQNGAVYVVKRPGTSLNQAFGASQGQGITYYNNSIHCVLSDYFYHGTGGTTQVASGSYWSSASPGQWTPRFAAKMIAFGPRMFLFGGYASGPTPLTDSWSTLDGGTWTLANSSVPFGSRTAFGICVFQGKIYLYGGYSWTTSTSMGDIWSSSDGVNWKLETPMAAFGARNEFACVAANNGVYIIGGVNPSDANNNYSDVWFSSDGVNFNKIKADNNDAILGRRFYHRATYWNGKLWVVAGTKWSGGVSTPMNDTIYSTDGLTWTTATSSAFSGTQARGGLTVYNNKMYYVGGTLSPSTNVYYTTNGTSWTFLGSSPGWTGRFDCDCVVWQSPATANPNRSQTLWIGPGTSGSPQSDVWRAQLDSAPNSYDILTTTTAGQRYYFATVNNGQNLVLKNQTNAWVYNGQTAQAITSPNYPLNTVDGVAVLDGYVFVMDNQGVIYNSNLADPFTWNSLDFIQAEYADDLGVRIERHLNYIVAFKQFTTEFFQDAGNALGSPLSPMLNYTAQVGCAAPQTVVHIDNTLIWVSQSRQAGRQVVILDGFSPAPISTPFVEKLLNTYSVSNWYAIGIKASGHTFFVLTLGSLSLYSLVFDITTKQWHFWNMYGSIQYNIMDTVNANGVTVGLDYSDGNAYNISGAYYNDNGSAFQVISQTQKIDAGDNTRKFQSRLELIGDKTSSATSTTITWTDDDYNTFSTSQTVDESSSQAALWRCGSFRRRAFKVSRTDSQPLRWEALELDIEKGDN